MKYDQIRKTLQRLKDKGYDPKAVISRWILEADENDPDIEHLKLAVTHLELEDSE